MAQLTSPVRSTRGRGPAGAADRTRVTTTRTLRAKRSAPPLRAGRPVRPGRRRRRRRRTLWYRRVAGPDPRPLRTLSRYGLELWECNLQCGPPARVMPPAQTALISTQLPQASCHAHGMACWLYPATWPGQCWRKQGGKNQDAMLLPAAWIMQAMRARYGPAARRDAAMPTTTALGTTWSRVSRQQSDSCSLFGWRLSFFVLIVALSSAASSTLHSGEMWRGHLPHLDRCRTRARVHTRCLFMPHHAGALSPTQPPRAEPRRPAMRAGVRTAQASNWLYMQPSIVETWLRMELWIALLLGSRALAPR